MKKKMLLQLIALLVLASSFILPSKSLSSHLSTNDSKTLSPEIEQQQEMLVQMTEIIDVHSDDTFNLSLNINIFNSPLAKYHRMALNFSDWVQKESAVPIESVVSLQYDYSTSPNVTKKTLNVIEKTPVKDQFLDSIREEHMFSFGINITEFSVAEAWGEDDLSIGFIIKASGELLQVDYSSGVRKIAVGPENLNASFSRAEYTVAKILIIQHMLNSSNYEFSENYSYRSEWNVVFNLPDPLNNTDELESKSWNVDLENGTTMDASITAAAGCQLELNESMRVTTGSVNATAERLLEEGLLSYKVFNMKLLTGSSCPQVKDASGVYDDWSMRWRLALWEGEHEWQVNDYVTFNLYANLSFEGKVGWKTRWLKLRKFEAWTRLIYNLRVNATVKAAYSTTFGPYELYQWESKRRFFHVGPVVGWYQIVFTPEASLDVYVDAGQRFTCEANVTGDFKAGVRWKRDGGWSKIFGTSIKVEHGYNYTSGDAKAKAKITPSLYFGVSIVFYDTAGPEVVFRPYATLDVDEAASSMKWNITLGLEVLAGVRFVGWLADFLGFSSWWWPAYNKPLWKYPQPKHDVAVTDVRAPNSSTAFVRQPVTIEVDVLNKGDYNENDVNVTLSYTGPKSGEIGSKTVALPSDNSKTVTFTWYTSGMLEGDYAIKADAVVPDDNNTTNDSGDCWVRLEVRNVAVNNLTYQENKNYLGVVTSVDINITVKNYGTVPIPSVVIFVYNGTDLISDVWSESICIVFELDIGASRTASLTWDVKGINLSYDLAARAGCLEYETIIVDNGYPRESFMPWDITGNGKCDINDVAIVALLFGSRWGDGRYNERADITGDVYLEPDGKIDICDIGLIALHFGESAS